MAHEVDIPLGQCFVGEDKNLDCEVLDGVATATDPLGLPVDIAGWAGTFDMRESDHAAVAMLAISCSVTGTYAATRAANTQRLRAALTDDQTTQFDPGVYRYSFKRTTAGAETVLAFGSITWRQATQR